MNRQRLLLALVLVYSAGFRLLVLNRPFEYDAEGSGSLNGVLARSYLRYGWNQTHGMPILSLDRDRGTPIVFYPDHPPLVPLLIVPFYAAFGVGEWQTRLPMSLMTLAAIVALYRLLLRVATPRLALTAAAVFAATPMVLVFGGFADVVGMPLIFFVLVALIAYLRFHDAPGLGTWWLLVGAFALAGICDWPAYVLVPVLVVHFVVTRPRRDWLWAFAFGLAASAMFAAIYAYITVVTHFSWTWMVDLFSRRSAIVGGSAPGWRDWIGAAVATNRRYHTIPLLILSATWVAVGALRRHVPRGAATVACLLLSWAALYSLIGAKALYDHEWAWGLLTPGLAVSAALLLDRPAPAWSVAAVAIFTVWTTFAALTELFPATKDRPFSPLDAAAAIRLAAPAPNDIALLVGNDTQAQLWLYGDRPLRSNIWSVEDFERRVDDETVDLMFNFDEQPWRGQAAGIVFPRIWASSSAPLETYLRERYQTVPLPAALANQFEVFDLRRSILSETR